MQEEKIYKKNGKITERKAIGETLLLPQYKSLNDLDYVYILKNTTLEIWKLIDGKKTMGEIKKKLIKKYAVGEKTINEQLGKFIREMVAIKALL